mmetsp:Transcript_48166/g.112717  ORF Transcript_48166/g.112717 Transcript_48166/m.112717 type:complete len:205 (+) Transcript_48166:524-1138(+)
MDHENGVVNKGCQRQISESFRKLPKQFVAVLLLGLLHEAIQRVHPDSLVVPSVQVHSFGCRDLHREQQQSHLYRKLSAIHEVPIEEVLVLQGRLSAELQNVEQIPELAMDVSHHVHCGTRRQLQPHQRGLLVEEARCSSNRLKGVLLAWQRPCAHRRDQSRHRSLVHVALRSLRGSVAQLACTLVPHGDGFLHQQPGLCQETLL